MKRLFIISKNTQKILLICLMLVLLVSLAACGTKGTKGSSDDADEVINGEITGEITVSCYDSMSYKNFLEEAAQKFESAYPGTKVNVETFSAMPEIRTGGSGNTQMAAIRMEDDPKGRVDYVNKVNTSLMSGSGADIFALDVLPLQKYVESGNLANLTDYLNNDPGFDLAAYQENIFTAGKYAGGNYFLPLDYDFTYYAYDSSLVPESMAGNFGPDKAYSTQELLDLGMSLYDGEHKIFSNMDYMKGMRIGMTADLFGLLLAEKYGSFVDLENKKANFNSQDFADLLKMVKEYGEEGYVNQGAAMMAQAQSSVQMRPPGGGSGGGGSVTAGQAGNPLADADRHFFKSKNAFSLQQHFSKNSTRRLNMMFAGAGASNDEDDEIAGIRSNGGNQVPFTYNQAYGINANSANKSTAWAFLKFLLSEEIQVSTTLSPMGNPVHKAARAQKAEMMLTGTFMGRPGGIGGGGYAISSGGTSGGGLPEPEPMDDETREVLNKYLTALEEFSGLINTYNIRDTLVDDMITEQVDYFFSGEKSAEEVAGALQGKVDLYLSE
ncbi:MAG: extracellular solute-binding protein [Clostridiales bacterium]|jgi:multiple sugar transport system substrate-binding protein|nr:extracellular solute-binding protein [Clostridiales bacterium]MDR2713760.1 extracellular solute-binding protein [Clostridiales bacterium]